AAARCDLVSRCERRRNCRAPRLSHSDRAVRDGSKRADAAISGRLQREAGALRRELHRDDVQRAAADRAGVRVRAGDEDARPAAGRAVTTNTELTEHTEIVLWFRVFVADRLCEL